MPENTTENEKEFKIKSSIWQQASYRKVVWYWSLLDVSIAEVSRTAKPRYTAGLGGNAGFRLRKGHANTQPHAPSKPNSPKPIKDTAMTRLLLQKKSFLVRSGKAQSNRMLRQTDRPPLHRRAAEPADALRVSWEPFWKVTQLAWTSLSALSERI